MGELPIEATGRVRWGIATCGKRAVAVCEGAGQVVRRFIFRAFLSLSFGP